MENLGQVKNRSLHASSQGNGFSSLVLQGRGVFPRPLAININWTFFGNGGGFFLSLSSFFFLLASCTFLFLILVDCLARSTAGEVWRLV